MLHALSLAFVKTIRPFLDFYPLGRYPLAFCDYTLKYTLFYDYGIVFRLFDVLRRIRQLFIFSLKASKGFLSYYTWLKILRSDRIF